MKPLVISAPFGNYFTDPNATSTLGTFTKEFRGGPWKRVWRVLCTVRYYPGIKAWRNKLGLPNPGMDWFASKACGGFVNTSDKIVSVSARNTEDWHHLLDSLFHLVRPAYVELNVSCPNCPGEEDQSDYLSVFTKAASLFPPSRIIVKLPPVGYLPFVQTALDARINSFHCCNTLPTPGGGLSGKPLQPLSLEAVRTIRRLWSHIRFDRIIGGGGVTGVDDAHRFMDAGATNVSVASVLFFPWKWRTVRRLAYTLLGESHAEEGRDRGPEQLPQQGKG